MSTGGIQGLDGKVYADVNERVAADNRWKQQEQQNELLEQQNQIAREQAYQQSLENEKNRRLQREQMENSIAIENSRQAHDREMRILSLCDNIGISKSIMDSYVAYIYDRELDNYECKSELNRIDDKIKKLDEEYNEALYRETAKEREKENKPKLTNEDLIKIYEDIKNKNYKTYGMLGTMGPEEKKIMGKIGAFLGLRILYIALLIFGCCFLTIAIEDLSYIFIPLIFVVPAILIMVKVSNLKKEIPVLVDKEIKKLKKQQKQEQNGKKTSTVKKKEKTSDELWNEIVDERDKRSAIVREVLKTKLDNFYKFRLSHYNSQLEKFLLDYGFEGKFRGYFKTITKSQAKANGDIDDYIDYFNIVINKD